VSILMNSVISSLSGLIVMFVYIDNNYYYFKDTKSVVLVVLVSVLVVLVSVLVALPATNHLHSNHQALVLVVLLAVLVLPVVRAAMNQHHTPAVLDMVVKQVSFLVEPLV